LMVLLPLLGAARAAAPGRYSAWFACGQPKLCLVVPRRRLLVLACDGAETAGERVEMLWSAACIPSRARADGVEG
jgi:hypothetical protein